MELLDLESYVKIQVQGLKTDLKKREDLEANAEESEDVKEFKQMMNNLVAHSL